MPAIAIGADAYTLTLVLHSPRVTVYRVERPADTRGEHRHHVTLRGGYWSCSCPAFRYSALRQRGCKHIQAVRAIHEVALQLREGVHA